MTTTLRLGATAAVFWLLGGGLAWACSGEGALFKDDFDSLQNTVWKVEGKPTVADGKLVMVPNAGSTNTIYTADTFDDGDICADVVVVDSPDLADSYTGVAFWVSDFRNLYVFQITVDGYAGVFRLRKDNWSDVIADVETESVVQGIGSVNEVRVVTDKNSAILYINGQEFKRITGTPPRRGQHIGYMVQSPKRGKATFEVDDLVVRPRQ
jgi:hypothetical protein